MLVPKLTMLIVESGEFDVDPISFNAMGPVGEIECPAEMLDRAAELLVLAPEHYRVLTHLVRVT
jgi:hypothetical protein